MALTRLYGRMIADGSIGTEDLADDAVTAAKVDTNEIATTVANTFTDTQTISSIDGGATQGPVLELLRDSSTPVAADDIGAILFQGRDGAGGLETYARVRAVIVDPTDASEDGKLTVHTVVAGALAERVAVGGGLWMAGATGGDPGAGKINATDVQVNGAPVGWTYGAQTATTSGTTVELSAAIPAWATEIEILFNGVSTNTANQPPLIQLGDSGGYETTSYVASVGVIEATNCGETDITAGFQTARAGEYAAADAMHGVVRLVRWDTAEHHWIATGTLTASGAEMHFVAGSKTLSDALTSIQLTTPAGAATFDAGEARVRYR